MNKASWFPSGQLNRLFPAPIVEALRRIAVDATTNVTGISRTVVTRSDGAGVFSASTVDLQVQFVNQDQEVIATNTIRGVLNTGTGTYHVSSTASTGQATTVFAVGQDTDSARMDVTHTASGTVASASYSAIDQSVSGNTPGTISSGGGGGGGASK